MVLVDITNDSNFMFKTWFLFYSILIIKITMNRKVNLVTIQAIPKTALMIAVPKTNNDFMATDFLG